MTENNKQNAIGETAVNAAPSQGRRCLMKGAMLATPAVMTLMSGRLMAATSMTCTDKLPTPVEGDNIDWFDANRLPLVWGDDPDGGRVLGYINSEDEFVPTSDSQPMTGSCLASFS